MEDNNNQKKGYGKRPLWFWIIVYLVIAAVVYFAIYYFFFAKNGSSYSSPTSQNTRPATSLAIAQNVSFAGTPDAKYAYLISTDNYDAATKAALAGFNVDRKVLSDGTQQINLIAQNPEYHSQSYTVKPGEKLYFIERFLQDDKDGQEKNMGDDTAVLVNANGYIVP